MPCNFPLRAFRSERPGKDGKHHIAMHHASKKKVSKNATDIYKEIGIPCGQCTGCRLERSRQWAIRCMHEAQQHQRNAFITLTYRPEDLPPSGGLVLRDTTTFLKRLRKEFTYRFPNHKTPKAGEVKEIRYFLAGEYGETTERPHYHILLFGFDFPDKKHHTTRGGFPVWTSKTLDNLWGNGNCEIGSVTFESAAYVARYIMKKVTGANADMQDLQRRPEFATMSRRPGIGASWLSTWAHDTYPQDTVWARGRIMKPPKAYDKILEKMDPATFKKVKQQREANATPETQQRRDAREAIAKARSNLYKRNAT